MIHNKADEVIEEIFLSLLSRCQIRIETSTKSSGFAFDCVHILHYKYHKINPNRGWSYIDSPDWTKFKKEAINPTSKKDNKSFQYTVTIALNLERGHCEL